MRIWRPGTTSTIRSTRLKRIVIHGPTLLVLGQPLSADAPIKRAVYWRRQPPATPKPLPGRQKASCHYVLAGGPLSPHGGAVWTPLLAVAHYFPVAYRFA